MERCNKLFLVRLYLRPSVGVLSLAMSAFSLFLGPRSGEKSRAARRSDSGILDLCSKMLFQKDEGGGLALYIKHG